jgi:hypothetical protein
MKPINGHAVEAASARLAQAANGAAPTPPIVGYRELSAEEVQQTNDIKELASIVGGLVGALLQHPDTDKRWVSIGGTHLQQGFMALVRAVTKPTTF